MVRKQVTSKKDPTAPSRPVGRPSKFTQEIADYICDQIVNGRDLCDICENDDVPSRATVYRWTCEYPSFATQYTRAREACADFEMDKLKRIADQCTEENVNSTRVKLNHYQWRIMKMAPRIYGNNAAIEVTGNVNVKPQTIDVRRLDADSREAFKQALLSASRIIEHDPDERYDDDDDAA
jgi:hypothetical protein